METTSPVVKQSDSVNSSKRAYYILFFIALLPGICAVISFQPIFLLLSVLSFTGACICGLSVLRSINKSNPMAAKWCIAGNRYDCDEVLESIRFSKHIYPADIGLVYFSGLYLFLLISTITSTLSASRGILVVPLSLAWMTSVLSLWYQWRVVRKWCRLCLAISVVLWSQAAVIAASFSGGMALRFHLAEWTTTVVLLAICLLVAASWLFIKPFVVKAEEVDTLRKLVKTWKRDPAVFMALQKKQPRSDVSLLPGEFVLGAADAPVQIMVALSLYCKACQFEYKKLDKILNRFSHKVSIIVRFKYDPSRTHHTMVLQYMLNKYADGNSLDERRRILRAWFEYRDLEKCKIELGDTAGKSDYSDLFRQYQQWFSRNSITRTPTAFINGYRLAEQYLILDLIPMMRHLPGRLALSQTINT
jgi:hypothetical protein